VTERQDWIPELEPSSGDEYKWAVDSETGELAVWEVGGPGDGFPTHDSHLEAAWGRGPRYDGTDILGVVTAREGKVEILIYSSGAGQSGTAEVPVPLLAWAEQKFPGRQIVLIRPGSG